MVKDSRSNNSKHANEQATIKAVGGGMAIWWTAGHQMIGFVTTSTILG